MANVYYSTQWADLEEGTVVKVKGDTTAVIGIDAFGTYSDAKSAGDVVLCDVFASSQWADKSGSVDVEIEGDTYTLTVGTDAFATLSAAALQVAANQYGGVETYGDESEVTDAYVFVSGAWAELPDYTVVTTGGTAVWDEEGNQYEVTGTAVIGVNAFGDYTAANDKADAYYDESYLNATAASSDVYIDASWISATYVTGDTVTATLADGTEVTATLGKNAALLNGTSAATVNASIRAVAEAGAGAGYAVYFVSGSFKSAATTAGYIYTYGAKTIITNVSIDNYGNSYSGGDTLKVNPETYLFSGAKVGLLYVGGKATTDKITLYVGEDGYAGSIIPLYQGKVKTCDIVIDGGTFGTISGNGSGITETLNITTRNAGTGVIWLGSSSGGAFAGTSSDINISVEDNSKLTSLRTSSRSMDSSLWYKSYNATIQDVTVTVKDSTIGTIGNTGDLSYWCFKDFDIVLDSGSITTITVGSSVKGNLAVQGGTATITGGTFVTKVADAPTYGDLNTETIWADGEYRYLALNNTTVTKSSDGTITVKNGVFYNASAEAGKQWITGGTAVFVGGTQEKFDLSVIGGGTSYAGTLTGIETITIDATAQLGVGAAIGSNVSITIDATDFEFETGETQKLLIATTKGISTTDITILDGGTVSDQYVTAISGDGLYLQGRPYVYSAGWINNADGDQVTFGGATFTIGVDAFNNYAVGKAKAAQDSKILTNADKYFSSEWASKSTGETVDVVLDGETVTLTIGDQAFATLSAAQSACDPSGATVVEGGTYYGSDSSGQTYGYSGYRTVVYNATYYSPGSTNLGSVFGGAAANIDDVDLTLVGSTMSKLNAANRYNSATGVVKASLIDSYAGQIYACSFSGDSGTNYVAVKGSTVGLITSSTGTNSCDIHYTIIDSTLYQGIGGAGSQNNANVTGDVYFVFDGVTVNRIYATSGIDTSSNPKSSFAKGNVSVTITGGTSTFKVFDATKKQAQNVSITIDASATLAVNEFTYVSGNDIIINVEGFQFDPGIAERTILSVGNGGLGNYNIVTQGTAIDDFSLNITGSKVTIKAKDCFFSAAWQGLADGTVVSTPGGTATIGYDAFLRYDDAVAAAAAKGWGLRSADNYFSWDWTDKQAGDEVTIENASGTFTTTIGDADIAAYNKLADAQTASAVVGSALALVGGTVKLTSRTNWNTALTTILSNGTIIGSTNGAIITVYNGDFTGTKETLFSVGDGAYVASIGAMGNITGATFSSITYEAIDGGTIGTAALLGYSGKATGDIYVNVDNGIISAITSASTGGTYDGNVEVVIQNNGYVGTLRFQPNGQSTTTLVTNHHYNITLDGSTIGTLVQDGDSNRKFVKETGATVNLTVTGSSESFINAWQSTYFDTLTIDATATLTVKSDLSAYTGSIITINVDNFQFAEGEAEHTVISIASGLSAKTIVYSGTTTTNYDLVQTDKSITFQRKVVVYSALWYDKQDGDIVTVSGNTYTIGTDAFANYNDAREAAQAQSKGVRDLDTYADPTWVAGETVTIQARGGSYTTVVSGTASAATNAFTTKDIATSAHTKYFSDGGIVIDGGTVTGRTWLNSTQANPYILKNYTSTGGGDQGLCLSLGDKAGETRDGGYVVVDEGTKINVAYMGERNYKTRGDFRLDVLSGGSITEFYAGALYDGQVGLEDDYATVTVNVNGGTIRQLYGAGSNDGMSYANVTVNAVNATGYLIYGGGSAQADKNAGTLTVNLTDATYSTWISYYNPNKGVATCTQGAVTVNAVAGTSTVGNGIVLRNDSTDAITIDADALLVVGGVYSTTGKAAYTGTITVDATDFNIGSEEKKLVFQQTASDITASFNLLGDTGKYALKQVGKDVYIVATPVVYSRLWGDKEAGETVVVDGSTYTIGTDAFSNYTDATTAATTLERPITICDTFYSTDWKAKSEGDKVTVTLDGTDVELTIGKNAFTTGTAASKAAGTTGAFIVYGGTVTFGGGNRNDYFTQNDQTWVFRNHHTEYGSLYNGGYVSDAYAGTVIIEEGSRLTKFNGYGTAVRKDKDLTVSVKDSYIGDLYSGNVDSSDTYTVDETTGKIIWDGTAAHANTYLNLSGSTASAIYLGCYNATTGDFFVTIDSSYVGTLYGSGANTAAATNGNETITVSSSTIGTLYGWLSADAGKHYMDVTFAGGTSSLKNISNHWTNTRVALTVNAGDHAALAVGCELDLLPANAVITIDVDNFQFGEEETSFTVLTAKSGISQFKINYVGTAVSAYEAIATDTSIRFETLKGYFSAGWAGLEAGTIVKTPNGTATIGENAFATYDEVKTKYATIIPCDTYYDAAWKDLAVGTEVTVAIPGGTFTAQIDNKNFCNTLATAQSALQDCSGNAVVFTGATVTGDRTTQISLNGKKTFLYNDVSAKFGGTDLGAIVVCDTSGAGTIKTGEAIIGEGSKLAVVYGNRNGSTAKDIVFAVTVQGGAYVENLATNFNGSVGSSDTYTVDETTGKLLWTGTADHSVMTVNVSGGTVKSVTPTVYSGSYTGDVVLNVTDGYVGEFLGKSAGTPNGNFYLNLAGGTVAKVTPATGNGDRYFEIHTTGDAAIGTFGDGHYALTIDENATLTVAGTSIPQSNVTNNGTLKLTNASFVNVVSGTFAKIGLVGGTGNIVINDSGSVSVYGATDTAGKHYYTATKQDNIYIDADLAGKSAFDKVTVKGGSAFVGVNAFAGLADAKDKSSTSAVATVSGTGSLSGDFTGSGIVFANTENFTVNGTISVNSVAFNGSGKSVSFATLHDFSNADLAITVDANDFPEAGKSFVIASGVTLQSDQNVSVTTIQGGSATTQTWKIGEVYEGSQYLLRYNSESHELSFYDKSAANITVVMDPEGWTNVESGVTVTATFTSMQTGTEEYSFDGKNWQKYTAPLTVKEHAYVMFRATTEIGGTTYKSESYEVKIDRIVPTIDGITPSATAWTKENVTIMAAYADEGGSGLKDSLYKIGDGDWQNYTGLITVEANAMVYFKASDGAGNVTETTYEVKNIDKIVPTISVTPSTTDWTKDDVTITAAFADDLSGVATQQYKIGKGDWQAYTAPFTVAENVTLYFKATDNAGNYSTTSYVIGNIDKIKPTITVMPSTTEWTNQDVTITVTFADDISGVATKQYKIGDGDWQTYTDAIIVEENVTLSFRATDNAGNVAETTYEVKNIDKIVPTITNVTPSTTAWTNQNVTITATYADKGVSGLKESLYKIGGGDWQNYAGLITVEENALVTLKATDGAGNVTETTYEVKNIDKIVPTISDITPSTTAWTNQDVTITATYADKGVSGLKESLYKIGGGDWQNYTGLITVEANAMVYFKASDGAGNVTETTYEVKNIDKIVPTISDITPSTTTWTNQDVTITATYADKGVSGLKESLYKIGDGDWQNYTGLITVKENAMVYFKASDNAGNVTETTYDVTNIDKIVPTVTEIVQSTYDWTNQDVTITANYADLGGSLLKDSLYRIGDGEWQVYQGAITVTENAVVYVKATDHAGNVTEFAGATVTNIDKTAPSITDITPSTTYWTNQDVTVSAVYSDPLDKWSIASGIAMQQYKIGDGEWQNYTTAFTVTENATLFFQSSDNAGNYSTTSYVIGNIDKIKPTITVNPSTTEWTNQDVVLSIDYADNLSGIETQEYSFDQENWISYTTPLVIDNNHTSVYFRATDKAGNAADVVSYTVDNIDKIDPTIASPKVSVARNKQSALITTEYADLPDEWGLASGIKDALYHVDDGVWTSYNAEKGITVYGNCTVYFKATDNAGNVTEDSLVIDAFSGPTICVNVTDADGKQPDEWTNSTVTVSAIFYANTPGTTLITQEYSLDGFEWLDYDSTINVSSCSTIYFRAQDSAGKSTSTSREIKIDHTAPTIDVSENSGIVNAVFGDKLSGIATQQYSFDQTNWIDYTQGIAVAGGTTVYFKATDLAGNVKNVNFTTSQGALPEIISGVTLTTGTGEFIEKSSEVISNGGKLILGQDSILVLDGIDPRLTLCGGTIDTNAGLATVESVDVIGTGNVISGIISGGTLSVVRDAQLTLDFTGENFTDSFAQFGGGAIYNNGEIDFNGNILFSGNAAKGDAIYNTNLIRFAGSITLGTASDAWVNQGTTSVAITNWDLRNAPANNNAVCINNYQYFTNVGNKTAQTITVNTNQTLGNYTIATGDLSSLADKDTFLLTLDDTSYSSALVANGAAITYQGRQYQLGVYATSLILTVSDGGRFIATSTNPVTLETGKTYTCPAYAGNGGAGEVRMDGTLTATGEVSFVGNAATQTSEAFSGYGGAIMNVGIAQLDAATYQYNSAVNGGAFVNCNLFNHTGVTNFVSNAASQFGGAFYNANRVTFGNYANFIGNFAANAGGAVCNDGHLSFKGANFTNNFAQYGGGAIYNNGLIDFGGNALFSGNASAVGGAIYNTNLIRLSGAITLETASDTWVNQGASTVAITNWDLRNAPADNNAVCINNYQYFSNVGDKTALTITVNAYQAVGNYTIATGDLSNLAGKDTFLLTLDDTSYSNALVADGAIIAYQGRQYQLGVYSTSLIMTVSEIGHFVVTNGKSMVLETGATYTCPAYAGNGGVGEVQMGGTLTAAGEVSFVGNAATQTSEAFSGYGGAIMNVGIAQLDAATYQYNSAVNGGAFVNCNLFNHTGVTNFVSNAASQFGGAFYNANRVTFGNYANFTGNFAANAGGAVCNDGQLSFNGANFTNNFAQYGGGAIYNNGLIDFGGNALFSGNASAVGGAIYNTNLIRLSGAITLETASDTWVNQGASTVAITNWDLRNAPADNNAVCINNYQYFSNVGDKTAQTITVNAYQAVGNYTIATGDLSNLAGKDTFLLTLDDTSYSSALVANGAAITYQGRQYQLGVYSTSLIMTVSATPMIASAPQGDAWDFTCAESNLLFSGTSFANDTLNIDTTNLTDKWTLLAGDTNCIVDLESAASVTFDGNAATWNGVAWSDGTFELSTDEAKKTLLVSKLA